MVVMHDSKIKEAQQQLNKDKQLTLFQSDEAIFAASCSAPFLDLLAFPWNSLPPTSTVEKKVGIWGEPDSKVLYVGLQKPSELIPAVNFWMNKSHPE